MKSSLKYYTLRELFVLTLAMIFNRLLHTLNYFNVFLPIRNDIKFFLDNGFSVDRDQKCIRISNPEVFPNYKYLLRVGTSDSSVFKQVLLENEYYPAIKLINERGDNNSIKFIVDVGSNIGLASLYFNNFFPDSKIIAIEPDESNFHLLLLNLEINSLSEKIEAINKALWKNNNDSLTLCNDFRDGQHWSKRVKTSTDNKKIQTIILPEIVDYYSHNQIIDILKIDIEGAEKDLFESIEFISTLVNRVRYMCLEIHDEFNIREIIWDILISNNFEFFDVGETTFCRNKILT